MADEKFILHVNSPMTLRNLCMKRIAHMALRFKASAGKEELRLPSTFEENHFVAIPSSIVEEILSRVASDSLRGMGLISGFCWIKVFRVLLVKPIERLEFVSPGYVGNVLLRSLEKALKLTNSQLKVLKLVGNPYTRDSRQYFGDAMSETLIMAMPSLTHLEVDCFKSNETTLETIGACCPHLTFLSLWVLQCSNAGLKSLCMNADGTVKRCQKLCTLKLDTDIKSNITDGILALLLGLPELAVLDCDRCSMAKAFQRLLPHNRQGQSIRLKIRVMHYDDNFCSMCRLYFLYQMCPFLEELSLEKSYVKSLQSCPVMPTLRKVSWIKSALDRPAFDNALVPFLEKNGKFLRGLHFNIAKYVNCAIVDLLCPNLSELSFDCVRRLDGVLSPTPLFSKLDTLNLCVRNTAFTAEVAQLLSNVRNVRYLNVYCAELNKEHFQDIMASNPFNQLVKIRIASFANLNITGETLDSRTPLSHLLRATL